MNEIGVNISQKRKSLNMTQEELSNRADISTNYVSRLERGEIDHIRAETLFNIAKGLNTTLEDLMGDGINKEEISEMIKHLQTALKYLDYYGEIN